MPTTGYKINATADGGGTSGRSRLFYEDGRWWACTRETTDSDQKLWKSDGTIPASPGDTGGWDKAVLAATGDVEFSDKASHRGNIFYDAANLKLHSFFMRPDVATPEDEYNRHSYNVATDDWVKDFAEEVPGIVSASDITGSHHGITADSNGVVWIPYYDFTANEISCKYRELTGSWTAGTAIRVVGDGTEPGSSESALAIFPWNNAGVPSIGVVFVWDGDYGFAYRADSASLSASWTYQLLHDGVSAPTIDGHMHAIAYDSGVETTSRICVCMKDGAGNNIYATVRDAAGDWDVGGPVEVGVAATAHTECTIAVDKTNDEMYVFYIVSGTSTILFYDKSATGTMSFSGTDTAIIEDSVPTASKGFAGVPIHAVDSTMNLRMIVDFDGTNQGWNEISIAAAPAAQTTGMIPIKGPWTSKPPAGTKINMSHPMVQDMFFFCAMDRGGDQVNLIDGAIGVRDTSGTAKTTIKATAYGLVQDFELLADETEWEGFSWENRPEYQPTELTIITRARPETESHSGGSRIVSKQTGSSDDYSIYYSSNQEEWHYRINGSDDVLDPVDHFNLGGILFDLALSVDTADQYNYAWEVELGDKLISDQNAFGATVAQNTGPLCIGIRGNSQERMFDGEIHYVAMWNKWRDQDFITAFRKNPWQIFEPQTRWVPVAAAAQAFGFIPIKAPWTRQPPLPQSVISGWDFVGNFDGQRAVSSVDDRPVDVVGAIPVVTNQGRFLELDNTNDRVSFSNDSVPDYVTDSKDFSVLFVGRSGGLVAGNQRIVSRTENESSNDGWSIIEINDTGATQLTIIKNNIQSRAKTSVQGRLSDNKVQVLVCTAKHTGGNNYEVVIWNDNVKYNNASATSIGVGDTDTFFIGRRRGTSDNPWEGVAGLIATVGRVLTDSEITSLGDNPWQVFEPRTIHIPIAFGAAAAAIFITSVDGDDVWVDGDTGLIILGGGYT